MRSKLCVWVEKEREGMDWGAERKKGLPPLQQQEVVKVLCQSLSLGLTSFFLTTLLISQIDHVMLPAKINHNKHVHFMLFLPAFKKIKGGGCQKSLPNLLLTSLHHRKKMCSITAGRIV